MIDPVPSIPQPAHRHTECSNKNPGARRVGSRSNAIEKSAARTMNTSASLCVRAITIWAPSGAHSRTRPLLWHSSIVVSASKRPVHPCYKVLFPFSLLQVNFVYDRLCSISIWRLISHAYTLIYMHVHIRCVCMCVCIKIVWMSILIATVQPACQAASATTTTSACIQQARLLSSGPMPAYVFECLLVALLLLLLASFTRLKILYIFYSPHIRLQSTHYQTAAKGPAIE